MGSDFGENEVLSDWVPSTVFSFSAFVLLFCRLVRTDVSARVGSSLAPDRGPVVSQCEWLITELVAHPQLSRL